jgi:dolichol-phosphate mannosyltransferase
MKKISLIFPVYNEEANLRELYRRVMDTIDHMKGYAFELILIDDCSKDRTPEILKQLFEEDNRLRIARFARNCGSHAAIAYGLNICRGQAAVILAADLQDPPQLIIQLMDEWLLGNQLVWGARQKRLGEKASVNFFSKCYYRLMNWFTTVEMPPLGADVFLADRAVINAFRGMTEKHTSIFMALAWLGFRQKTIDYVKEARHAGQSKWTLGKKIKLTLDSLLAFSDIPIRYMSILGIFTAFLGFMYAVYVFWSYIQGSPVEGWSSIMVAVLVIGGMQMIMLGFLGEYLWRTYDESRKRPRYVIESMIETMESPQGILEDRLL